jgi:hypothetical protein
MRVDSMRATSRRTRRSRSHDHARRVALTRKLLAGERSFAAQAEQSTRAQRWRGDGQRPAEVDHGVHRFAVRRPAASVSAQPAAGRLIRAPRRSVTTCAR